MQYISVLNILFANQISKKELPLFRGAVISSLPKDNILFHNHISDTTLRYSYPLIQYKRINGRAAIVCIGEGSEAIKDFFTNFPPDIYLGEKDVHLQVDRLYLERTSIQVCDEYTSYHINSWLPFNKENYERYQKLDNMTDKITMLEHILTGNILSLAKGTGLHFEKQISCKIADIARTDSIYYKGVRLTCINADFRCNVSIPVYIGLGKGVSIGHGVIYPER